MRHSSVLFTHLTAANRIDSNNQALPKKLGPTTLPERNDRYKQRFGENFKVFHELSLDFLATIA